MSIGAKGNNFFMNFFSEEGKILFTDYINNIFVKVID